MQANDSSLTKSGPIKTNISTNESPGYMFFFFEFYCFSFWWKCVDLNFTGDFLFKTSYESMVMVKMNGVRA